MSTISEMKNIMKLTLFFGCWCTKIGICKQWTKFVVGATEGKYSAIWCDGRIG